MAVIRLDGESIYEGPPEYILNHDVDYLILRRRNQGYAFAYFAVAPYSAFMANPLAVFRYGLAPIEWAEVQRALGQQALAGDNLPGGVMVYVGRATTFVEAVNEAERALEAGIERIKAELRAKGLEP
jgi:hypothetical protein